MTTATPIDAEELTPSQERAILALLAKPSIVAAAKSAGVGETTLRGWLRLPVFVAALRRARAEVLGHGLGVLATHSTDAVATLKKNLKAKEPAVQVRAAVAILDRAFSGMAVMDLQDEIEELRVMLADNQPPAAEPTTTAGPPSPESTEVTP